MFKVVKLFLVFLIFFTSITLSFSKEIKIILKVNNDIITNQDIKNEIKYLQALNKNLRNFNQDQLFLIGKDSLLREKLKKNEILKFSNLGEKKKIYDVSIIQILSKLNLSSIESFKSYLKEKELDFDNIYRKIEIENLWNQLVYNTYKDKVIIDEVSLKKKILANREKQKQIKISEILFESKNQNDLQSKYENIIKKIDEIGFDKTVALFSISDSKKNSGKLGWVNENILSDEILNKISNLKPGEISNPIIIPSGILILRVEEKRIIEKELNIENELEKMIAIEINSQLNIYSQILFNKIKEQAIIDE